MARDLICNAITNKMVVTLLLMYYFDIMLQVNHILTAIKRKKSMDTIILSLVASVCTFLIFIYWLTK